MMERYVSYKVSGVEWIGEIPIHWKELPLRYYFSYTKGSNGQKLTKTYIEDNLGTFPVYSGQTENNGILGFVNEYEFDFSFPIVFTTTVGAKFMTSRLLNGKFSLSQNCLIMIKKRECVPSYFQHFFSFDFEYRRELIPTIIQPSLRMEDLDRMTIILPPLSEQSQIVQFLDEKTSLIDSLIEKTTRKMELLKEERISLINHTVTKGLNPNVEIKESGVEWIGEIPCHWNSVKLKQLFCIQKRISGELGYDVLSVTQRGLKVKDLESNEGQHSMDYSKYQLVFEEDFVMNHMDLLTGYVDLSKQIGVTSPDYRVFTKVKKDIENKFYLYIFQLCYLRRIFYGLGRGVSNLGRWRLPSVEFLDFYLPFPPLSEQSQIVQFLDEKTAIIDKTIELEGKRIEYLKEYRQSLISEVVTGKIKVITDE
jgi:type I restriction enzyme S subunit